MLPIKDALKSSTSPAGTGLRTAEEQIDARINGFDITEDHSLDAPPLPPVQPYFTHEDEPTLS